MKVTVFKEQGRVPVTVLQPHGNLDDFSYRDLIVKAREVCTEGIQYILLDLSDTPHISYSGLMALHNIAAMLRGDQLTEPNSGWDEIYAITSDHRCGPQPHLKLLNPQPDVDHLLEMEKYKQRFLEVHTDLETAVASF